MKPVVPRDLDLLQVKVLSTSLCYTESGEGRPVVAVHGIPASSHDFRWLDAAFDDRVRFLRINLPGFGGSAIDAPQSPTFEGMALTVAAFCEAMDLRGTVLLGHSFGGAIAVKAALDSDRIDGVVLVNSSGPLMHRTCFWRTYKVLLALADLHPALRYLTLRAAVPVARRAGFSKKLTDAEMVLSARLGSRYDPAEVGRWLARLDKPALVVWTPRDPAVQPAVPRGILQALVNRSELRLDAKTHNLQASHACEIADAVIAWAREQV